jgi:hypothetical protein
MATDLLKYSEQAMNLLGGKLPNIAYLPPAVRGRKVRVTTEGVVTDSPFSSEEQLDRIVQADPIGFLIAVMNGQPIPTFRLVDEKNPLPPVQDKRKKNSAAVIAHLAKERDIDVYVEYHVPSIADRERIALYLADRVAGPRAKAAKPKPATGPDDFGSLVDKRARDAAGEERKA